MKYDEILNEFRIFIKDHEYHEGQYWITGALHTLNIIECDNIAEIDRELTALLNNRWRLG